jgi:hypothetical protein
MPQSPVALVVLNGAFGPERVGYEDLFTEFEGVVRLSKSFPPALGIRERPRFDSSGPVVLAGSDRL